MHVPPSALPGRPPPVGPVAPPKPRFGPEKEYPRPDRPPRVGSMIHYIVPHPYGWTLHRPAVVTSVHVGGRLVNLHVFLDSDDYCATPDGGRPIFDPLPTSVPYDGRVGSSGGIVGDPRTWHWPEEPPPPVAVEPLKTLTAEGGAA